MSLGPSLRRLRSVRLRGPQRDALQCQCHIWVSWQTRGACGSPSRIQILKIRVIFLPNQTAVCGLVLSPGPPSSTSWFPTPVLFQEITTSQRWSSDPALGHTARTPTSLSAPAWPCALNHSLSCVTEEQIFEGEAGLWPTHECDISGWFTDIGGPGGCSHVTDMLVKGPEMTADVNLLLDR